MRIEGTIFKAGEIPKKLFKILSGTVRETRNKTYHDLIKGDYVAMIEYLLGIPVEEDVITLEECEIEEVSLEDEYLNIIRKIIEIRKIIYETSVNVDSIVLDDFNFENANLDEFLKEVESLLTLSAGELPEDRNEALKIIEEIEDDKIITKVNLVKKFVEKFPDDKFAPALLIETASKVYLILNDRYIAKSLLKKVLISYSHMPSYCYEAARILKNIYEDEGNVLWRRYEKLARVIEVIMRGNS
ncbi:MAG: cyclic nucleotide-binding domain-containing protein [Fervidobacterium sp.]